MPDPHPLTALYPEVRARLAALAESTAWPDFEEQVARHLTRTHLPLHLILPLASAAAVGGEARRGLPVSAACGFLLLAMRWLDDLADRDREESLWQEVGAGRATNMAAAALTVAWRALAAEEPALAPAALSAFGELTLELARGQDADLAGLSQPGVAAGVRTLESYWQVMRGKSGAAVALAGRVGALAARPDLPAAAEACGRFGRHLGTALQILDDLDGAFHPDGVGDLAAGKVTLPVLYGLAVEHPRRGELAGLIAAGRLAAEAERAREILDGIDTREFLVWSALEEHRQALSCLADLPVPEEDSSGEAAAGREAMAAFADAVLVGWEELLQRPDSATSSAVLAATAPPAAFAAAAPGAPPFAPRVQNPAGPRLWQLGVWTAPPVLAAARGGYFGDPEKGA